MLITKEEQGLSDFTRVLPYRQVSQLIFCVSTKSHKLRIFFSGSELGGILGRWIAKLIPVATKVGKVAVQWAKAAAKSQLATDLKNTALTTAGSAAIDALLGASPSASLETGLDTAKSQIASAIKKSIDKKPSAKKPAKRKEVVYNTSRKKKRKKDNFDLFTI